jgi:hypothetical protein
MYEHKKQQLAPIHVYRKRLKINALIAFVILVFSLFIGMLGYKLTIPEFDWYDSLLNASMILSGMGPVVDNNIILTKAAKVFASIYAIFSGVTFLTTFGIFLTPVLHRFFHKLHLEETE